ncbi:MAG TPA: hypothetical protein VGR77_07805 [Candidatus Dormibacteraeota bacterium]|nr:hypothetical protein [Candidatus Dormibacteraeota bacterium]
MIEADRLLRRAFAIWLPVTAAATLVILLIFATVQQDLRLGANDPQIQMAEDAAAHLDAGASPTAVLPSERIDIAHSLAPFVIVFDRQGQPLASSAALRGETPLPPHGVFTSVPNNGRNQVTWQPAPGVRSATIVVAYAHGYVLAGRSLRVVEERESSLGNSAIVAWLGMFLFTGIAALVGSWALTRSAPSGAAKTKSAA